VGKDMIDWRAVQSFGGLLMIFGIGKFLFSKKDTFDFRTGMTTHASAHRLLGLKIVGGGFLLIILGFFFK
jgi:hypothetical protein